ncbi:hypothetical protein AAVH_03378 [Aphelenchoides avenae]|nr:hypothetical protein AAVH_03378 [Aphelenchus avenae]
MSTHNPHQLRAYKEGEKGVQVRDTCCAHQTSCPAARSVPPVDPSVEAKRDNVANEDDLGAASQHSVREVTVDDTLPGQCGTLQRSESCINATDEQQADDRTQVSPISRYYIGMSSCSTAEKFVRKKTAFRIYHRQVSGRSQKELPLYVVYRASTGEFFHYPIMERPDELHGKLLYVDYGDSDPPEFVSLSSLVKYYTTYCVLRQESGDGEDNSSVNIDVFPWWILGSDEPY